MALRSMPRVAASICFERLLARLHDAGQRSVARLVQSEIGGDHRRQRHRDGLQTAVDLAHAAHGLVAVRERQLRDEGRLRPAEQLGQELADDVGVVVDRLLAEQQQIGALLLDDLLEDARDDPGVGLRRGDENGAVRAHREAGAELLLSFGSADGHEHHLGAGLGFFDAERFFDRDLAERVHDPLDPGFDDAVALGVHLDGRFRVRDALYGDQYLHRGVLLETRAGTMQCVTFQTCVASVSSSSGGGTIGVRPLRQSSPKRAAELAFGPQPSPAARGAEPMRTSKCAHVLRDRGRRAGLLEVGGGGRNRGATRARERAEIWPGFFCLGRRSLG